jgi:acyl-coenzyme A thioesterase 7
VPTIAETRFQMVQLVFPEYTNTRGTLYGGQMMSWIATAGTLAASRFARGPVVLGAMDDLDFLTPAHTGEIVTIEAQVEYVGRTSLEVGVEVHSESPRTGSRRKTTSSHLAFIALDEHEFPRPVNQTVTPGSAAEEALYAEAAARKAARAVYLRAGQGEEEGLSDVPTPHTVRMSRLVMPEDALSGTLMFAGKFLRTLDEAAAITAVRYCRGPVVTASLDAVYFYHPLRVGQIVDILTALTHVGRSSMEIGVRVDSEEPRTGRRHYTCTAFLTMVHLHDDGRSAPVPPLAPATAGERRPRDEADARWKQRKARVAHLRDAAGQNA